ncbi:MAG TPA: ATP-binding protein [Pseudonocardia sp.]|nr:ATP-binding protein [Pseudonocardia sp.]
MTESARGSTTGSARRGRLRVYLGAAPGVGKTYAMLAEGRRRADRGTDVVIGFVECHGRRRTEEQMTALDTVPRLTRAYRGAEFRELDLDAVLARRPEVALVDELAHTNVPGGRNEKRWQDIEELLAAGISVITTVNVQHLESLNDVVERITGIPQRETVPDAIVRAADQIELVDMSPEALRRRMAHGNIYHPDKVDAALANYFRIGNLHALRELALLWLANRVDEGVKRHREENRITRTWETRERVVVALTGGVEGATLIRRAARIAARTGGGDLLAVHVARADGLAWVSRAELLEQQRLVQSLGGTYHEVLGDDIPTALLEFARAEHATQLVLGTSRRRRLSEVLTGPGVGATTTRLSGDIDVHMVTHEQSARRRRLPLLRRGLSARRRLSGAVLGVVLLPLLTMGLVAHRDALSLSSQILLYLSVVVLAALLGGLPTGIGAAVAASLLLDYYFTAPIGSLAIADHNNLIGLLVFVFVATAVSSVVEFAARRAGKARRAAAESDTLAMLAGSVLGGEEALPALLDRLRETFAMDSVALLRRDRPGGLGGGGFAAGDWTVLAHSGDSPCTVPGTADTTVPVGETVVLALCGRALPAADRRILVAFAARVGNALEQRQLSAEAAQAGPLAEVDRTRTALLAAVSHDLRTPLAAAKAAVSSLADPEMTWSAADHRELLATADESIDRLITLVHNLLDTSRLQAGALPVDARVLALSEIVPVALDELGAAGRTIALDLPADLPEITADPDLLQRIIANVAANAVRYAPPDSPVRITASALGQRVELRVIDRGPGVPVETRESIFVPFQRLGDRDNGTGVGLGLALSRGLAQAMDGTLDAEDTPGGGLTMVLTLPAVEFLVAPVPPAEHTLT